MNLRPLIIDRYLFREFAMAFFAVIAFCALLLLVASIFDRFSEILEYGAPMSVIATYFLSSLPGQLMQVVPIASMLAVLFSIGSLARTNEILAMLTSGVHALRLSLPVVFGGILIVLGTFVMNEYVVPPLEQISAIYKLKLEDKDTREITMNANVLARGRSSWFYMARVYSNEENKMMHPTIVNLSADNATALLRMEGNTATFAGNSPSGDASLWTFDNLRTWKFDASGRLTTYTAVTTPQTVALEAGLPAILAQQIKPDQMNYSQLKERVEMLETRDQPTYELRTDLLRKLTFPLGILVIMLIGFSYAVKSRAGTAMKIIGYGISWSVGFYIINAVLQALGHAGTIPPLAATALPLFIFAGIAMYLMRRSYQWHA